MLSSLLTALAGSGKTALAVGFPAGQNMVEGAEASMMTGASAARAGWRKAWVAAAAGLVTLMPFIAGLWFAYRYVPGEYIDYAIAILIFGIGIHEIMEGIESRPSREGPRRHRLDGPLGIDPADPNSVRRFQEAHGLEPDGVLGPLTRGAIAAELRRRGDEPRPNRLGVDVTDEISIRRFQRRLGLEPDGVIGPRTQGALAAEASFRLLDPADAASIRRFQARHRLRTTGIVDEATQEALRATRAERRDGDTGGGDGQPPSPYPVDVTSGAAISRYQRERGLPATGVVDRPTQGALRAELERRELRLGLDPADPDSVRRFQQEHSLEPTGFVDERTQAVLRAEREASAPTAAEERTVLGLDPTDPQSIERFQALHGLEESGEIDEDTQEMLRRVEEWTAGLDPLDPDSIRRFQNAHGLETTGIVDHETQGAMRLYRNELEQQHEADDDANPTGRGREWYPLDPADPESVSDFQREHGLAADGRIGPDTQAALRAVTAERGRRAAESNGGGIVATYGAAWPAYFGILLEGGEASLFTIGLGHGTGDWYAAAIGGGGGFIIPWLVLLALREWVQRQPEWAFQLVIGVVLASAATIFGLFRATGVFGG